MTKRCSASSRSGGADLEVEGRRKPGTDLRSAVLGALLLGCAPEVATHQQAVIYGEDDRREPYEETSAEVLALVESSVALFDRGALRRDQSPYGLPDTFTLGEAEGLCEGERFADQPTAAWCSGTLIAPDLVLTAGHCVPDLTACLETEFVFDYRYVSMTELAEIEPDDVYACAALEAQQLDVNVDFAIVRLDRPAVDRSAASLLRGFEPVEGTALTSLGYGSGLPLKIDPSGAATGRGDTHSFEAQLDAFRGQSGAGVFWQGRLVGVLRSGQTDYVRQGDCRVANRVGGAGGEQVLRLSAVVDALCRVAPEHRACAVADAGPPRDAGPSDAGLSDAGPSGTGPSDAGPGPDGGGCSIRPGRSLGGWAWVLLGGWRRRRRRGTGS